MSVIRILLHNNLIHFGSPASTAFRSAFHSVSRPTTVALTPMPFLHLLCYSFYFLFMCIKRQFCCLSCLWHSFVSSASMDSVVYHWGILFNNVAVFRSVSSFENEPYYWLLCLQSMCHCWKLKKRWAWSAVLVSTESVHYSIFSTVLLNKISYFSMKPNERPWNGNRYTYWNMM